MIEVIIKAQIVLLSDEDRDLINHNLCIYTDGYVQMRCTLRKKNIYLHTIIAQRIGIEGKIDHKDRNKLNNQRDNFRSATQSQNGANRKLQSNNTTGYRGVSYYERYNCYVAQIMFQKKQICLGRFKTAEEAALAYNKAAVRYFGEFAVLNEV